MADKGKFTQGSGKQRSSLPDAHVTRGGLETPVQAFMGDILDGGKAVPALGYQDNDTPGERHINIQRRLGAGDGPATLQRFRIKKNATGRSKD